MPCYVLHAMCFLRGHVSIHLVHSLCFALLWWWCIVCAGRTLYRDITRVPTGSLQSGRVEALQKRTELTKVCLLFVSEADQAANVDPNTEFHASSNANSNRNANECKCFYRCKCKCKHKCRRKMSVSMPMSMFLVLFCTFQEAAELTEAITNTQQRLEAMKKVHI